VNGLSRRPLLMLIAFAVGIAAPVPWLAPAVLGLGLAATAVRLLRWGATRHQASRTAGQAASEAVVLGGDETGRRVLVSDRELSAHGLILGASGSGKTTSLLRLLTEQIRRGRPVIAIDLKGSPAFVAELSVAAKAAGRPLRAWTPDGPERWNPLAHGNATELKDKLIATERFTEPHYQRAAERYLLNVLQVLQAHPQRSAPTLDDVVALMDPHRLRAHLRGLRPELGERVNDYLAGLTPDQLSAIRGLQTRLAILTESHTGQFLTPGPGRAVDVRSALAGEEVVVFSLNSSQYGQLAAQLGTLAVQDLICTAGDRLTQRATGLPVPQATAAVDEFSGLGAENIAALFARGRESGLAVIVATQEMTDLDRAARGLREQVLGNTAFKLTHRQDVPASAQLIAQLIGTETRIEQTEQVGGSFFSGYTRSRTRREAEQFIIHPNRIKSLRTGEAVLISKLRPERPQIVRVGRPGAQRSPRGGPELG
jgi:type IV secretory pathway TraG/TraD family ATPase VirD4